MTKMRNLRIFLNIEETQEDCTNKQYNFKLNIKINLLFKLYKTT